MADDGVPSSWAIGWTAFAGTMMVLVGTLHIIAGIAGIAKDDVLVRAQDYTFQFSTTTWGWIHLIAGIVVLGSGLAIFSGSVFARTIGVFMALLSAVIGFTWIPYYPVWGVVIVAIAVSVIWALTAHGRDITRI
jgi:hypothetical protein